MNWLRPMAAMRRRRAAPAAPSLPTPAVLVVEDDELIRDYLCSWLQMVGLAPLPATSGEEALALIERNEPPVRAVITDGIMSGMDGFELARQAAHHLPSAPVVMVTGFAAAFAGRPDLPENVVSIFAKPFSGEELMVKLQALLADAPERTAAAWRPAPRRALVDATSDRL